MADHSAKPSGTQHPRKLRIVDVVRPHRELVAVEPVADDDLARKRERLPCRSQQADWVAGVVERMADGHQIVRSFGDADAIEAVEFSASGETRRLRILASPRHAGRIGVEPENPRPRESLGNGNGRVARTAAQASDFRIRKE